MVAVVEPERGQMLAAKSVVKGTTYRWTLVARITVED